MPSVVLPEPDSPTMPSVSPRRSCSVGVPHRGEAALVEPAARDRERARRRRAPRAGSARRRPAAAPRAAAGWRAASSCTHAADRRTPTRSRRPRPACRAPSRRRGAVKRRTRLRSWVMNSSAMPISACSASSRARICACTVTSSAVVGSSQMRSFGSHASAIAIIARWRWPPESWCGKLSTRRSGSGMPVRRSSSIARARAAFLCSPRCSSSTSPIWLPTVYSGFSAVIGSWKIIAISVPRMPRISRSDAWQQVLAVEADRAARRRRRRRAAAPTGR